MLQLNYLNNIYLRIHTFRMLKNYLIDFVVLIDLRLRFVVLSLIYTITCAKVTNIID